MKEEVTFDSDDVLTHAVELGLNDRPLGTDATAATTATTATAAAAAAAVTEVSGGILQVPGMDFDGSGDTSFLNAISAMSPEGAKGKNGKNGKNETNGSTQLNPAALDSLDSLSARELVDDLLNNGGASGVNGKAVLKADVEGGVARLVEALSVQEKRLSEKSEKGEKSEKSEKGDKGDKEETEETEEDDPLKDDPYEERLLTELGPDDFFGEIALLQNENRTATVTCLTACTLLTLSKADFRRFLSVAPEMKVGRSSEERDAEAEKERKKEERDRRREAEERGAHREIGRYGWRGERGRPQPSFVLCVLYCRVHGIHILSITLLTL